VMAAPLSPSVAKSAVPTKMGRRAFLRLAAGAAIMATAPARWAMSQVSVAGGDLDLASKLLFDPSAAPAQRAARAVAVDRLRRYMMGEDRRAVIARKATHELLRRLDGDRASPAKALRQVQALLREQPGTPKHVIGFLDANLNDVEVAKANGDQMELVVRPKGATQSRTVPVEIEMAAAESASAVGDKIAAALRKVPIALLHEGLWFRFVDYDRDSHAGVNVDKYNRVDLYPKALADPQTLPGKIAHETWHSRFYPRVGSFEHRTAVDWHALSADQRAVSKHPTFWTDLLRAMDRDHLYPSLYSLSGPPSAKDTRYIPDEAVVELKLRQLELGTELFAKKHPETARVFEAYGL
jgi:hypothetical protein